MLKKALIGLGVLVLLVAIFGGSGDDDPDEGGDTQPRTEAAETRERVDTGRMSDTEFSAFRRAHDGVVRESLQFSQGLQKCAVIGQTGDLAEFSRCVDESYDGFDDKTALAAYEAEQAMDDTAKQCQAALRTYGIVLNDLDATVRRVHELGSSLQIVAMGEASKQLPGAATRYRKFSTNALNACEPR